MIAWNWWVLAVIPLAWFLQNCVHELSHLAVGWVVEGRKPVLFKPYPHRFADRWFFARCESGIPSNTRNPALRHIAPYFAGILVVIFWMGINPLVPKPYVIFLVPFILAGLVDATFFSWTTIWGSPWSDGQRFKQSLFDWWEARTIGRRKEQ
jgi:hypothetical protein